MGIIIGAVAGILLTFLAANSKMHAKNDEMKQQQAQFEKEKQDLQTKNQELEEASNDESGIQSSDWNLVLVNEDYPLEQTYAPSLTDLDDTSSVDSRIADAANQMLDAAKAAGMDPVIISAYRSYDEQKSVFNNTVQTWLNQGSGYYDAFEETKSSVREPGLSEHQLGLALDITPSDYQTLDEGEADTDLAKWLAANCQNYGFILRYPKDKTDVTGIVYEPWHFRYVGNDAAKAIMEQGITLEEYLAEQK